MPRPDSRTPTPHPTGTARPGHVTAAVAAVLVLALASVVLAATALALAAPRSGVPAAGGTLDAGGYAPPVAAPFTTVRAFDPPETRWSAGHRGVDLRAAVGSEVLAPADGVVTFVGPVAGRSVVTIRHPDGRRSSLEPVVSAITTGTEVHGGQLVGTVQDGVPTHCAPETCLHWGVREGEAYVDPMALVLGVGPIVLLPTSR